MIGAACSTPNVVASHCKLRDICPFSILHDVIRNVEKLFLLGLLTSLFSAVAVVCSQFALFTQALSPFTLLVLETEPFITQTVFLSFGSARRTMSAREPSLTYLLGSLKSSPVDPPYFVSLSKLFPTTATLLARSDAS